MEAHRRFFSGFGASGMGAYGARGGGSYGGSSYGNSRWRLFGRFSFRLRFRRLFGWLQLGRLWLEQVQFRWLARLIRPLRVPPARRSSRPPRILTARQATGWRRPPQKTNRLPACTRARKSRLWRSAIPSATKFGEGRVLAVEGSGDKTVAKVRFGSEEAPAATLRAAREGELTRQACEPDNADGGGYLRFPALFVRRTGRVVRLLRRWPGLCRARR